MTHQEAIRKLETDIELRGMSPHTIKEYRCRVKLFLEHFDKPVEDLNENDFRIYLELLSRDATLSPATVNNYNSALRFFFEVTLEQTLCYRRLPRKKDPIKLPNAFTRQEILWFMQAAFKKYHKRARIPTEGSVHTLRHSYATHLLEDGVNVFFIQRILGHATLWTTMRYLRIAQTDVMKTKSPLDKLMEKEEKRKARDKTNG